MSEASTSPPIKTPSETPAETPEQGDAGGIVGTFLAAIVTIFLTLFLTELNPYRHWEGSQSWLWWLVRWPLVVVVSFVLGILVTMAVSMLIPPSERDESLDLSGFHGAMFLVLFFLVGGNGESLMNVYNAAFGKPLFVLARCEGNRWSPGSGYRTTLGTSHIKFQLLDGPDAGELLSTGRNGPSSPGNAVSVVYGYRYVLVVRRSWMGMSIVEVRYSNRDRQPPEP